MRIIESISNNNSNYNEIAGHNKILFDDNNVTKTFNQKINWIDALTWAKLSEVNKDSVVQIQNLIREDLRCIGFTYKYESGQTAKIFTKLNFGIEERIFICLTLIEIYNRMLARQTIYLNWNLDNIIISDEIKLASPNSLKRISKKEVQKHIYDDEFLLVILSILYGYDCKNNLINEEVANILKRTHEIFMKTDNIEEILNKILLRNPQPAQLKLSINQKN